jgi:hypothetical protein
MGNDGGSIPIRKELVKEAKYKVSRKRNYDNNCSLTLEPFKPPLVICKLGQVYNKESLLKALIEKEVPESFNHIKTRKDFNNVNKNSIKIDLLTESVKLFCPVSLTEYTGKKK